MRNSSHSNRGLLLLLLASYPYFSMSFQQLQIPTRRSRLHASSFDDVYVMVNGMPGPMATAAAEACLRKGLKLCPMGMTGPEMEPATISVLDTVTNKKADVRLVPSNKKEEIESTLSGLRESLGEDNILAIDYTHPSAVNGNAIFYKTHDIPFVMGTTGGDREQLISDMEGHTCVIAPNMGKQIVAMQAALEELSRNYPGAFDGYTLKVVESHQKTKADTSGTAKALVDSIKILNSDPSYSYSDIEMVRGDEEAIEFGVSPEHLRGHAFHTYTLTSPDGSVQFQLQHNVSGRTVYAEGTADAIKFLSKKLRDGAENRVYNMIDVLKEGALE